MKREIVTMGEYNADGVLYKFHTIYKDEIDHHIANGWIVLTDPNHSYYE